MSQKFSNGSELCHQTGRRFYCVDQRRKKFYRIMRFIPPGCKISVSDDFCYLMYWAHGSEIRHKKEFKMYLDLDARPNFVRTNSDGKQMYILGFSGIYFLSVWNSQRVSIFCLMLNNQDILVKKGDNILLAKCVAGLVIKRFPSCSMLTLQIHLTLSPCDLSTLSPCYIVQPLPWYCPA